MQKKKECVSFDNKCKQLIFSIQQIVPWNGFQSKIHLYNEDRATFKITLKAKMQRT